MDLYLIRHTRPDVPPDICYGQAEVDVAESFLAEAAVVREKLAGVTPVACYSSPLRRCAKLAAMLSEGEIHYDPRLMELSFGIWEMQRWQDIPRSTLDQWGNAYIEKGPPGGESFRALHARASAFVREIAATPHAGPVLAITHAGVIRALLAEALHQPLEEAFRFHLDFGGITRLQWHEALPSVVCVNQ